MNKLISSFSKREVGTIRRLRNLGFRDIVMCPNCRHIFGVTILDFVPYTSKSYIKCRKCGYHIYHETFDVDELLKGPVNLNRKDMHYYSMTHRRHSKPSPMKKLTKKDYDKRYN